MATPETRNKPNVLITGTPGTGKSTLAQELANRLGFDLCGGKIIRENNLVTEFDPQYNSHVLDEDKLLDHIEDRMNSDQGGAVVDYHGSDFFPERWFDFVIVLRCSTEILFDRLSQRGYDEFKIKENVESEIFGSLAEEARDAYPEDRIHEMQSETVDEMHENLEKMCQMWQKIRYGVRWNPAERLALASRALDLKTVKSIDISMDPLHSGNHSLRVFWHSIMAPKARLTNPQVRVKTDIRNDRQDPFFVATLDSGKKLRFNTNNMPAMDVIMRFNRLLGNPELSKAGTRPMTKI